jgi:nucleotide-binding universal stress UspA family protein
MTKILCPIDFSSGSRDALRVAARLAQELDRSLEIVHAWYLPSFAAGGEYPLPADSIQGMVDDAERGLTEALDEARKMGSGHVATRLLTGPPWERIVEAASPSDLIVMGTHGRSGISRFLLGSVAEKVVRHASCSVLIARPNPASTPFRHLLVPVDFSECSRRAVDQARALALRTGARITLLHVLELPMVYRNKPSADLFENVDQRVTAQLHEWAELVERDTQIEVERIVRTGTPAAQAMGILTEDSSIDLVVVGSHGRTGMKRLLLGSVAEKLVRHAGVPVLVAR